VNGELVDAPDAEPAAPLTARTSRRAFWITGLVTSLVLAGFVSFYASSDPDGLERVAADQGFDKSAGEHAAADSPLADYGVKDVEDARLSGGLAGVTGVGVTVVAGSGVFWAVRRRRTTDGVADGVAGTSPANTGV
jgi:cobalt/nickel transport system permease protein